VAENISAIADSDGKPTSRPFAEVKPDTPASFEQSLADLEEIVRQLEEGQIGLADSLAKYELGVKRLKECYELLERAERRIELLERVDANGDPITRPFEAEATIERHTLAGDGSAMPNPASSSSPKAAPKRSLKPVKSDGDDGRDLF